jgi:hypothetical protein
MGLLYHCLPYAAALTKIKARYTTKQEQYNNKTQQNISW